MPQPLRHLPQMGDCIMPREGVFARVLEAGQISIGDQMSVVPRKEPFPSRLPSLPFRIAVHPENGRTKAARLLQKRLIEEGVSDHRAAGSPGRPGGPGKRADPPLRSENARFNSDHRRNRLFLERYHSRSHSGGSGAACPWNRRGNPGGQHGNHQTGHAQPGSVRDPG